MTAIPELATHPTNVLNDVVGKVVIVQTDMVSAVSVSNLQHFFVVNFLEINKKSSFFGVKLK